MPPSPRTKAIREFILDAASEVTTRSQVGQLTAAQFNISRQAVSKYVTQLVQEGLLEAEGNTRAREYRLSVLDYSLKTFPVITLDEDLVWTDFVKPLIQPVASSNVLAICGYGVLEMVNNVIDHSESTEVTISVLRTAVSVTIRIEDKGVGIFEKIQRHFSLANRRHVVFELSMGKLTTDPERHTGEGIFFTSRMSDGFLIDSDDLSLAYRPTLGDWLMEHANNEGPGTTVVFIVKLNTARTDVEVFAKYTSDMADAPYMKTQLMMELASGGEPLVSRSQARRIMARADKFGEVCLVFTGVETISPAFADEIFRVWKRDHPEVQLIHIDATPRIEQVIARVERPTTE